MMYAVQFSCGKFDIYDEESDMAYGIFSTNKIAVAVWKIKEKIETDDWEFEVFVPKDGDMKKLLFR